MKHQHISSFKTFDQKIVIPSWADLQTQLSSVIWICKARLNWTDRWKIHIDFKTTGDEFVWKAEKLTERKI